MALSNNHICPVHNWIYNQSCEPESPAPCCTPDHIPLVSKCGTFPPESCFFSLICSLGAFMVMLLGLLRYAHVIERGGASLLNTAGLATGWICAAGLIVVGSFQVDHAKALHYAGAGAAFPTSMLFLLLQSVLTYRMAKSRGHYWTGHLRSLLAALALVALVFKPSKGKLGGKENWQEQEQERHYRTWVTPPPGSSSALTGALAKVKEGSAKAGLRQDMGKALEFTCSDEKPTFLNVLHMTSAANAERDCSQESRRKAKLGKAAVKDPEKVITFKDIFVETKPRPPRLFPCGAFFNQHSTALQHLAALCEWLFITSVLVFYGTFTAEFGAISTDTFLVLLRAERTPKSPGAGVPTAGAPSPLEGLAAM